MSELFTPLTIRGTTFRNRLWVSSMCQYSSDREDGVPNDWHHVHLAGFATGGAGLVLTEATSVSPEGRISPQDTGLWNRTQEEAWAPIVSAVHARGAAIGAQLAHAGRKASTWRPFAEGSGSMAAEDGGWRALGPSPEPYEGLDSPLELDDAGIQRVIDDFRTAAGHAAAAGFDVVEIHAAHGYLLHQFLSPLSNLRSDDWGGSLENRARLTVEAVRAVRAEVGADMPVFVRLSAVDFAPGGLELADVAAVARWCRSAGADLFDVSAGGLVAHQQIDPHPGYQVPFAAEIRRDSGALTAAVGLITTGAHAEQVLREGDADAVLIGREFLRDPHFARRAATELGESPDRLWPRQHRRVRPLPVVQAG